MKLLYIRKATLNKIGFSGSPSITRSVKISVISAAIMLTVWSCEFLDYNEFDRFSKDEIFYEFGRVKTILTNVYTYLPTDYNSVDGAIRSAASDDAEHVYDVSDIQKFNDGSWNAIVTLDNQWGNYFSGVRAANVFLEEADGLTFEPIKYNLDYSQTMEQFKYYPYEARFLRAFYYFELIKRYKNVPLVTTVLTQEEANNVTQSSFDEIVEFIVTECDSVAAHLPVSFTTVTNAETGRATKGAAMALKARTLLYAASPLNNIANDQARWIRAAQAAKDLMDQLGTNYTPLPAYTAVVNNLTSKELIFERRQAAARTFETANTAIGFIGGNTGTCPTQNLVDAYEMKPSGLGINEPGSGYVAANPYANRDPRLAMTVLYNGAIWKTLPVETWYGGLNAPPKQNATKTGYYLKKYMIESIRIDPVNPSTAIHYWIIFRYAEVLLNYAEAMNEAYGPNATGPGTLNMTARTAVNIVRARTGIVMPAFGATLTQDTFRDKLRNERRVELAFEDHRFWDIRRWTIGDQTREIYGVDITKDATTGLLTFNRKLLETRVWDEKMNIYPIPQTELYINKNLVQNEGW
jgi:hypothetical protein